MKTLFFFIVLSLSLTLNAQITKGNWLVGGSASFGSSTVTSEDSSGNEIENKGTSLRFNPNIGYFISNKFALGLDLSINFANSPGPDNSNWAVGFGPFVRYYFLEVDKLINFFSEASFNYNQGLGKTNDDRSSTRLGLALGSVLFFNSSVGIELSLNYNDLTSRNDGKVEGNTKDLFIALGFQIHLEK